MKTFFSKLFKRSKVNVNGQDFEGSNIEIVIDGNVVKAFNHNAKINIVIYGDASYIKNASGDITVNGDINGNIDSSSGDIKCENISCSVTTTSGSVTVKNTIGRDVTSTTGDISAKSILGNVKTQTGNIRRN